MKKLILISLTLSALSGDCEDLFQRYEIDPHIKSSRGWKRVINNDKLGLYINYKDYDKKELEECLIYNGFKIKRFSRSIGKRI